VTFEHLAQRPAAIRPESGGGDESALSQFLDVQETDGIPRALDEPRFFIALPNDAVDVVPLDATELLGEWERGLDPAQSLHEAATWWLLEDPVDWTVGDHFVAPSWTAVAIVRQVARAVRLLAMLAASDSTLAMPDERTPRPVSSLVDRGSGQLTAGALPLLYGLAVGWTAWSAESYHARSAMRRLAERTARDITPVTPGRDGSYTARAVGAARFLARGRRR
jgi:hypothetical protein